MEQKIVNVDSWDGSASNYSTVESYAKASLLNFNMAAGRGNSPENWTKSLIKLPVRREGDSSDTFVDKAVIAAVGGNGITAVVKPTNVSEEDFNSLMKKAANDLIKAYGQMDKVAPESVYKIAGKERPSENQTISFDELYYQILDALYLIDEATGTFSRLIDCYLTDDKNLFAVIAQNGKLYKQHFMIEDDMLMVGDFEEIPLEKEDDEMPMASGFQIIQQEDGRYRWCGIAATTALNKNGNLNSKQLYDSFIDHINETGEYPILNFYHQPNTRLGVADFAARDDNLYILSGTFDDNKYGIAAAQGLMNDEDGYWGQSIEFWFPEYEWYTQDVDGVKIQIPVFRTGINDATSILPAKDAACLGTGIISKNNQSGGLNMNEKVKEALSRLMGTLADDFEEVADSANQEINENTIHQETVEDEVIVEEVEDEEETVENEGLVLDETFIPDLLDDLNEDESFNQMVQARIDVVIEPLLAQIQTLQNELKRIKQGFQEIQSALQETEQEQRQRWNNDKPSRQNVVSYRPRAIVEPVTQNGHVESFESAANKTLNKIKRGVK